MSLTDSRRLWKLAHERGTEGVHSHELRRLGVSGNPSQRAKDIADHVPFWTLREARNGRPGSRYWADGFQPSDAVAVRPNGVEGGQLRDSSAEERRGGNAPRGVSQLSEVAGSNPAPGAAPLNIVPAPPDYTGPTAIVRDWNGEWAELPWDEEKHRPREAA